MVSWLSLRAEAPARALRGRRAECLARDFLEANGFVIRETNVRFRMAEIDIIAMEGDMLCFVEVRSTSSDAWGGPMTSIKDKKRRRLIRAASLYLQREHNVMTFCRFDVVGICWRKNLAPLIELIRGAFDVPTSDLYQIWV